MSTTDADRCKYINYINDNINELKINFRKEVLQMIKYSDILDDKIVEKGNGSQVKYSDIDNNLLKSIYNFIQNKRNMKTDFI